MNINRLIVALFTVMLLHLLSAGCDSQGAQGAAPTDSDTPRDTASDTARPTGSDTDPGPDSQADPESDPDRDTDSAEDRDTDSAEDRDTGAPPDTAETDPGDSETVPWVEEQIDSTELPDRVPVVEIQLAEVDKEQLEGAPFYGADVPGVFVDSDGNRYDGVDINYRGAYALQNLMVGDPIGRRNWKVKFSKAAPYRGRREWNFNFEPHLRQKLAYDLMKFAGVTVPDATHVVLKVNGEPQGIYLQYADPDSKGWLYDKFGDDSGDLYKAATDMPASEGEPEKKYFAETTYLGALDSDYHLHYRKKTNHKDPQISEDWGVLRTFLDELNHTPGEALAEWLEGRFAVEAFISYLVVSNFISNWDSFPHRPKNYWLYENRRAGEMVFIPWDLDATFQEGDGSFNQMGTDTDLLFSLKRLEYEPIHEEEGTERPLATRMMNLPVFEAAYVARYRELSETVLSEAYLQERLDALESLVSPHLTDALASESRFFGDVTEREAFEAAMAEMREYVSLRAASVREQLTALP